MVLTLLCACAAGTCAPRALPDTAAAWVADKRAQLARTMWAGAGIVRRRADMKGALRSVVGMHHEVQVGGCSVHTAPARPDMACCHAFRSIRPFCELLHALMRPEISMAAFALFLTQLSLCCCSTPRYLFLGNMP